MVCGCFCENYYFSLNTRCNFYCTSKKGKKTPNTANYTVIPCFSDSPGQDTILAFVALRFFFSFILNKLCVWEAILLHVPQ